MISTRFVVALLAVSVVFVVAGVVAIPALARSSVDKAYPGIVRPKPGLIPPPTRVIIEERVRSNPRDAGVDELVSRLAALKAKEVELTDLLRAKLLKQQDGLERLKKLGLPFEKDGPPSMQKAD